MGDLLRFNHLFQKLKSKFFKKLPPVLFITILALSTVASLFALPIQASAAGNTYNFSDMQFTETVQICSGPTGPCSNSNFIRVAQNQDFYVQVTIAVTGLTNTAHQTVNSLDFSNDEIYVPGWTNTNLNISGVGPSFVAKVTQQQAQVIQQKIAAGADPSTIAGVPCYTESITTTGGVATKGVAVLGGTALFVGTAAATGGASVVVYGLATAAAAGGAASTVGWAAISGTNSVTKCDGPVRPSPQGSGTVNVGSNVYQQIIAVPSTSFSNLGISQQANSANNASTEPVNELYVVPDVYYSTLASSLGNFFTGTTGSFISAAGAGKSIYVQLYDNQTDLTAHLNDAVPGSVPNNGSNTGSGQNVNGGGGGNPITNFLTEIIGVILGIFQEIIFAIFSFLVAPLLQALLSIQAYKDTFVAVIYPGWIVIRNLCDIMFIVALIVIAMATLFRIDSYQYKHLLVQLIIAALLINFSLVVGQAVLGIADTVQAQFLPANVTVIKSLAGDLMVNNWRKSFLTNAAQQLFSGSFSDIVIPFFYLALSLGSFMVFVAIAAFLFIRILALWVLLMISPVAYVCGILPATEHYRTQWWETFLKYAFFTPIMAFFLNMAAIMSNTSQTTPILQQVNSAAITSAFGNSDVATFVFKVGSNILLLIFLIAGLMVADKFSIIGAKQVSDFATKYGWQAPFGLTAMGAKAGGNLIRRNVTEKIGEKIGAWSGIGQKNEDRAKAAAIKGKISAAELARLEAKVAKGEALTDEETKDMAALPAKIAQAERIHADAERKRKSAARRSGAWRALSFFDPKVVSEAWKKREHEKEAKAYEPAIGYMQDTLNRVVPSEWLKSGDYPGKPGSGGMGKKTFHGLVAKRDLISKETKELQEGVRTRDDAFKIADAAFDSNDKHLIHAALKILQHGNWQDDYMNARGRLSKTHSILRYMKDMHQIMSENNFDEEEELEVLDDLQETGEGDNRFRAYGYRCTDGDGVVRAAYDLEYLEHLQHTDPVAFKNALEEYANKFIATGEKTKIQQFTDIGNKLKEAANNGSRFADIKKEHFGEGDDETLEDAIIQRRFLDEANIKLQRGQAGGHAGGLEAAIFADQDPEKGWRNLNLMGMMLMNELPPTILRAYLGRIHQGQARPLKAFGAVQDELTGKWQLPEFVEGKALKGGNVNKGSNQGDAVLRLVNVYKANPAIFTELIENKQLFGNDNVEKFTAGFKGLIAAHPEYNITPKGFDETLLNAKKSQPGYRAEPTTAPPPTP
ncbi:MAG: hypothetical protein P4L74_00490 [Candidatus Doudnabacteria bacterium]|nr:hypothetical protein [Candidatus Doudnabacteria bacterium]